MNLICYFSLSGNKNKQYPLKDSDLYTSLFLQYEVMKRENQKRPKTFQRQQ